MKVPRVVEVQDTGKIISVKEAKEEERPSRTLPAVIRIWGFYTKSSRETFKDVNQSR